MSARSWPVVTRPIGKTIEFFWSKIAPASTALALSLNPWIGDFNGSWTIFGEESLDVGGCGQV
jgi:hypothetical protein